MNKVSLLSGVRAALLSSAFALFTLSSSAQTFLGTNAPGTAQTFSFTPGAGATNLALSVAGGSAAYSHLLLKAGTVPNDTNYDFIASLDGAGNAINLEAPQFQITNYVARVRTPVASLQHA